MVRTESAATWLHTAPSRVGVKMHVGGSCRHPAVNRILQAVLVLLSRPACCQCLVEPQSLDHCSRQSHRGGKQGSGLKQGSMPCDVPSHQARYMKHGRATIKRHGSALNMAWRVHQASIPLLIVYFTASSPRTTGTCSSGRLAIRGRSTDPTHSTSRRPV